MIRQIKLACLAVLLLINVHMLAAQNKRPQPSDSTKTTASADTSALQARWSENSEEIELSEISIEAVVEKPRVAILPRRMTPELGEMEFVNRSFERELKQAPDKPMIMDNRLLVPQKIEDLKKKLISPKKPKNK